MSSNVDPMAQSGNDNERREEEARRAVRSLGSGPITIAVVGRGGAGKSSTVNSLVGKQVAPVSHGTKEGTLSVREYDGETDGFAFKIFDTPGFGGTRVRSDAILDELGDRIGSKLQILLYVIPLNLNRLDSIDRSAIRLIHQAFAEKPWKHTVIVFTRADEYGQKFAERAEVWKQALMEEISRVAGRKAAEEVGFVAISNGCPTNPDGLEWMGELFTVVVERIDAPLEYLASQSRRINRKSKRNDSRSAEQADSTSGSGWMPPINLDEQQRQRLFRRVTATTSCTAVGATLGGVLGGPVGALVGGGIGAIVGLFLGEHL
jgi:small GTP-binding protein